MTTFHEEQTTQGFRSWGRTRWLVLTGLLIAVAVAVVLVLVYTGGGGSGGGGGY
jgi:hypothetical protein